MSKRYYLCDVVGDGSEENPIRPSIADYNVNWVGEISGSRALVLVNTVNHAALLVDPKFMALPEFPLDGKINAMQSAAKNKMVADMQSKGFDTGLISSADGYRDVIRGIGKQLNQNFDENNFDVSE